MVGPAGDNYRNSPGDWDAMMEPQRRPRMWIVVVYLGLLALVIPWYWPADDMRHAFGLPLWVIVTLIALLVTSVFTAWVFLTSPEDDTGE